jgi:hypothetical protein
MVSRAANLVIPAQAGIHKRNAADTLDRQRIWIPASAGMTMERLIHY